MAISELVTKTIAKLSSTTQGFERDLNVLLPALVDEDAASARIVFLGLFEPLLEVNHAIQIALTEDELQKGRCDRRSDIAPGSIIETESVLLRLDHDLMQMNLEIGFTFTVTSGHLPSDLHKRLSNLLSAGEAARVELDALSAQKPGNEESKE